jgi:HlyD family secretion protein
MKKPILIVGSILVLAAGFFGYRFVSQGQAARAAQSNLQTAPLERGTLVAQIGASGTVRANQSATLNWQTSGTVAAVGVAVGDQVSKGTELASLAQSSLPQSVIQAQADLVDAQKALDDLLNSYTQSAQAQQAVEDAQNALDDARQPALTQAQAQQAIADAQKAVEQAQINLNNAKSPADQSYIDQAASNVTIAKDKLDKAWDKYKPYADKPEDNLTRARLLSDYAAAQQQYDAAVRQLNGLQGTASATDIAQLESDLATAQAQLSDAQRQWERVKDGPSQAEIATLEAKLADAQRQWERVKDGPAPDDVAAAQARVAAAQATINQAHITAPFAGEITQVSSTPGDQVSANTPAFRLDDLSRLLVDVPASEVDINQIQAGQPVTLTFDSILNAATNQPKEYHGKVAEVATVGEQDQGVVNFTVTVELTNADQLVKPGMTAGVEITVNQLNNVLLIPNQAVRTLNGERVVYVQRGAVPTAVPVTLGSSSDTYSQLLDSNLQAGDLIVLNPPSDSQIGPGSNNGGGGGFGAMFGRNGGQ